MLCRNWCIDVKYFSRWRNGRILEILKILHDAIFTLEMHFHEKNSISTSLYEFNISSEQQWFIANTFIFLKNIGGAGSHCLTVTRSQQITLLSKEPCSTNIWIFLILKFSKFTRFDVLMTKNEKIDFGTSGSSRLILLKLETSWKSTIYLTEFFRTILFSGFWKDKHQLLKMVVKPWPNRVRFASEWFQAVILKNDECDGSSYQDMRSHQLGSVDKIWCRSWAKSFKMNWIPRHIPEKIYYQKCLREEK